MASRGVEELLNAKQGLLIAAAGHGKTELLSHFVASGKAGRQLVLTHTHAGVAAIKSRLRHMKVPIAKYHVDTIAGWCLRLAISYPAISDLLHEPVADSEWNSVYLGAERVCDTDLGAAILRASYEGVLIDEYQDCSSSQHAVVLAIARRLPCRAVGDPMQGIFGFRGDTIPWRKVQHDFGLLPNLLETPWRWRKPGATAELGEWLITARKQLERGARLVIEEGAPVRWVEHEIGAHTEAWARVNRTLRWPHDETGVLILKWPRSTHALAKRLGGRWPVVERFDPPELRELGAALGSVSGPEVVKRLVDFVAGRMTGIGPDLSTIVNAIMARRSISRIRNFREHAELLEVLALDPRPTRALAWLEMALAQPGKWFLYRRECVYHLREALRQSPEDSFTQIPSTIGAVIARARHRGRQLHSRSIGTPLLIKGLEFDHAVLFWEPDHLSAEGAYVALSRASKSLTIVSRSRTLVVDAD